MEIVVNTEPGYTITLGQDKKCFNDLAIIINNFGSNKKIAIVTDENIEHLYLNDLLMIIGNKKTCYYAFPAGEKSKNRNTLFDIFDFLAKNNITRNDMIIAFGGGVVGDITGFAAATFLRGISYIQIPTSLLAMVDSSIGGKTAINIDAGKNLVGSFYQPAAVIVDTFFLDTLPKEEWKNGIGEIIKYAAIKDKNLFEMLEKGNIKEDLLNIISICLNIKREIVEIDTNEKDVRKILNFGHTLGHGIEKASGYDISHGKAVGIGMVMITKWAEARCLSKIGTAEKIKNLLKKYDMPYDYELSFQELWDYAINDKKTFGNNITLILLDEIGECKLETIKINNFLKSSMNMIFYPSYLKGELKSQPSKSLSHRALFCSLLAKGTTQIENIQYSEDILATIEIIRQLGIDVETKENSITVINNFEFKKSISINCNESGTTFRFILPILAALGIKAEINGRGRLGERPYETLINELKKNGIKANRIEGFPLRIEGKLKKGKYYLPGDISSQYISGLLFALPLLEGDSEIILTSNLESNSYVEMTVDCLKNFGIVIKKQNIGYFIKGNQNYLPKGVIIDGDYSSAAFFLCAGAINGEIAYKGLNESSLQGDKEIISILKNMGADIETKDNTIYIKKSVLNGIEVDITNIPDLAPVLAVVMALAKGKSTLINTKRLRLKECDREKAIYETLKAIGANIEKKENSIEIVGKDFFNGGIAEGNGDHRIVMALSIAALKCKDNIIILGTQNAKKSYPNFFIDYKKLGGKNVIYLGN